eukprot:CAMPEP_0206269532 /NCGR_PEP_ID=MMETSP0047_2-20121206/32341_1 /ASSEMBLY_ACC=CAM_ASM_000192 /TAXON_ID=195065 /ORGANISM="Chroomonas mesostigmatica_cf, Strain CCMP1168" /LENGTH=47 /DNA_ID= /DNA_START= /DNA_END= /DNA_ORIENTATION=
MCLLKLLLLLVTHAEEGGAVLKRVRSNDIRLDKACIKELLPQLHGLA